MFHVRLGRTLMVGRLPRESIEGSRWVAICLLILKHQKLHVCFRCAGSLIGYSQRFDERLQQHSRQYPPAGTLTSEITEESNERPLCTSVSQSHRLTKGRQKQSAASLDSKCALLQVHRFFTSDPTSTAYTRSLLEQMCNVEVSDHPPTP